LLNTYKYWIVYDRLSNEFVVAHSDLDWAQDSESHKFIAGHFILMAQSNILDKLLATIVLSSLSLILNAIDLREGFVLEKEKIYLLSRIEREKVQKFVKRSVKEGNTQKAKAQWKISENLASSHLL